jgi:membrane fusion protein (multidrug efflux system)
MNKLKLKSPAAAILLAATALAVLLASGSLGPSFLVPLLHGPTKVSVAVVSLMDKETPLALAGAVEDSKATLVTAQLPGRISEVYVSEGQVVKPGQPLAKIDAAARPVPADGPAPAGGVQAAYDSALKDYERYKKLYEAGAVARRQFEAAAARLQLAREAQSGPGAASSGGVQPSGPVELAAPRGGTVTGLAAAVGKTVQTGQQLMVLQNPGEVRVVSHLARKDLYLVRPGTLARVTVADMPGKVFTGWVDDIYPEVGQPTFRVHIQVDHGGLLKPGMAADVRLSTGQGAIVHGVPSTAIVREQGLSYLYLVVDGRAVRQQVTTGATSGDYTEITSDLAIGTFVVNGGAAGLKDGDLIELQ